MELAITFCGDIALGGRLPDFMGRSSLQEWLGGISEAWRGSDLVIGNLEGPCVMNAVPVDGQLPELILYSSVSRLPELAAAGFSAVTLGNNHIMDCGRLGLQETLRGLEQAGVSYAGAGMNLKDAARPALTSVRGVTVGLVSFCYGPPATSSEAGAAPYDQKIMRSALAEARASADLVIGVLHDGLEYSDVPPSKTRKRLRFLAENGADIVVGHHPHVLQGIEWHKDTPIICSLGDLLSDNSLPAVAESNFARMAMGLYAPAEIQRDPGKFGRGALLTVHIAGSRKSIEWHPFRQSPNLRPELLSGKSKAEDLQTLEDLSAALLNSNDYRHNLADSVFQAAVLNNLDNLGIRELLKLSLRPKWRYIPKGLKWLYRQVRFV